MKKYITLASIIIITIVIIAQATKESDGVRIGFIGNLTGEYSEYTVNFKEGVELAKTLHNEKTEEQVQVVYEDDAFESKRGQLAFQKLTNQDKVQGIINVTTPTIGTIKQELNAKSIPTIQFGIEPDGSQDDYIFTIYPGGVDTEKINAQSMKESLDTCTNPIIVFSQVDAMISQKEYFKQGYQKKIEEYVISSDISTIRSQSLTVAKEVSPDCIVLQTTPADGAQFIKNYLLYSNQVPKIFFSSIFYPAINEYKKVLGNDMTKLGESVVPVIQTYSSDAFKNLFREKYQKEPGAYAEFGFDAFNILINSRDKDTSKWKNNIQETKLEGVSSYISYTDTGTVEPRISLKLLKEVLAQ